jgi:hypothetical protein
MGRLLSKVFQDPTYSMFGRYHLGLWRSYGNMIKPLIGSQVSSQDKVRAVGQLAMAGVMAYEVYPLMDKFAQWMTGNDQASVGRRGLSTIPEAVKNFIEGDGDYASIVPYLLTPSIPLNMASQVMVNRDWSGKPIVAKADLSNPVNAGRAAVQGADWAARNAISPYGSISAAAEIPGAGVGSVAQKFAEQSVGIKNPSPAEQKYKASEQKYNIQDAKRRAKKPPGLAEGIYENLTR